MADYASNNPGTEASGLLSAFLNTTNCGQEGMSLRVFEGHFATVMELQDVLDLNVGETNWLLEQPADFVAGISDYIEEMSAIEGQEGQEGLEAALVAANILLDLERSGLSHGPYDNQFYNIIGSHEETSASPIYFAIAVSYQCAVLKLEHPDWPDWKIQLNAVGSVLLEGLHLTLDGIGLVPGFGEVADLTNGVIYTLEGEWLDASLSVASAIPFAGWFSTSTKWAKRALPGSKTELIWIKSGTDVAFASSDALRSQLRRILKTPAGQQAHHILPLERLDHPVIQKAAKGFGNDAWHPNELANGMNMTLARHNGSHANYNARVLLKLDQILDNNGGSGITSQAAITELTLLMDEIRTVINNNPGTKINDLIF